jgi:hypothetical protein
MPLAALLAGIHKEESNHSCRQWRDIVPPFVEGEVVATARSGCGLIVLFGYLNGRCDVAANGVDQHGHAFVPTHSSGMSAGLQACRRPSSFVESSSYLVTRPVVRSAIEIIDSMQLLVGCVVASVLPTPRRRTVNMSSSPSRNEAAELRRSALSSSTCCRKRNR